jgi:hypothetical protein
MSWLQLEPATRLTLKRQHKCNPLFKRHLMILHGLLLKSLDNKLLRLKIKLLLLQRLQKAPVEEVLVGVNRLQEEDLLVAEVVEDVVNLLLKYPNLN